jgi:hypothetical protein
MGPSEIGITMKMRLLRIVGTMGQKIIKLVDRFIL